MVLEPIVVSDDRTVDELTKAERAARRNAEELRREADRYDRLAEHFYNEAAGKHG